MGTLLKLPREIRHLIYLRVLTSELAPPTSPRVTRGERELSRKQGDMPNEGGNYYPLRPFPSVTSGLLLLCRQVYAEVRDTIALLKVSMPLRYKIDIMFDHEFFAYPTWLSIPYPSAHINTVDVDLRYFGATLTEEPGRRLCGGNCQLMTWQLLRLLERFLVRGPDFLAPATGLKLQVRVVNINIRSTFERDDVEFGPLSAPQEELDTRHLGGVRELPSSDYLRDTIHRDIFFFFGCEVEEADLIGECVDHIKISIDGQSTKSWDLKSLAKSDPTALMNETSEGSSSV